MTSTQAPTTSGFRQIFSSDDVSAYIRQGCHGWTVVLFESAGLVGRGHEAPRRGFIEEADLSVVLIKAHRRNWYPQKVMLPCLEAVLTHAAGARLLTYGASMGGYAAIKFASALQAQHVVAISPQFSIDPKSITLKSDPFTMNYNPALNAGMDITAGDAACPIDILFDPLQENDQEHVELICRQLECRVTKVSHAGHGMEVMFGGGADLYELIWACVANDRQALAAQIQRKKRLSVYFQMSVYRSICDCRPRAAKLALFRALWLTPLGSDDHVSRAQALIKMGRSDAATAELLAQYEAAKRASSRWVFASALANVFASMRQPRAAVTWAHTALSHAPDDENVVLRLVQFLLQNGAVDEAEQACRSLMTRFDLPAIDITFSQVLAMQGQLDTAIAVCQRALNAAPTVAAWHFTLAGLLDKIGSLSEADATRAHAVAVFDNAASWLGWSRSLQARGRKEEALAAARRAVLLTPSDLPMRNHLAQLLLEAGMSEEALNVCRESVDIRLGGGACWLQLARTEEKLGLKANALASAEFAVAWERWNADIWAGLLDIVSRLHDETAVRQLCAAADEAGLIPTPVYLATRGRIARDAGDLEPALAYLQASVSCGPPNAGHLGLLARCFLDAGQNDAAAKVASQAVTLQKSAAWIHICLIDALERQNKIEEAISACEAAILVDGSFAAFSVRLAKLLDFTGQITQASDVIDRALAAGIDTAELRGMQASIFYKSGRKADAVAAAQCAVEIAPTHAGLLGQLASYLLQDGRSGEAAELARAAIKLAPGVIWLQKLLDRAILSTPVEN